MWAWTAGARARPPRRRSEERPAGSGPVWAGGPVRVSGGAAGAGGESAGHGEVQGGSDAWASTAPTGTWTSQAWLRWHRGRVQARPGSPRLSGCRQNRAGQEAGEKQPASREEEGEDVVPVRLGGGLSSRRSWGPRPGPGEAGTALRGKETAGRKDQGRREQRAFADPREVAGNAGDRGSQSCGQPPAGPPGRARSLAHSWGPADPTSPPPLPPREQEGRTGPCFSCLTPVPAQSALGQACGPREDDPLDPDMATSRPCSECQG